MAKQESVVKLSGTIGGFNFFYRKGKPFVRIAGGGFDSKKIKNSPTMVRVRENASEFGMCSKAKKALRLALNPFLHHYKDATLHGRMMTLLQEIKTHDGVSARGQRKVGLGMQTAAGQRLLREFAFSPKYSFEQLLGTSGAFDAATCAYAVADFSTDVARFPAGATHVEIHYGVLRFDFETLEHQMALCPPLLLPRDAGNTSFHFTPDMLPEGNGMLLGIGCVRFYQELNGNLMGLGDFGCGVLGVV
ncbi:MAG: hypothetical protein CFE23_08410 [Flavobacterium sp. BFFFF1]|uniref:hypothetical protein n=1 Tax=Flavobacterium sp. BFFFF1 TaxID=2015557 RepID=UPI000BD4FAF8|nr:hypothetical protein [Flavobacterium sp. BFFFF1]OYU80730.1 MAG: hypothetical protein CFE23_08410 [Flavobacterium sp. BFFFF1]